MRRLLVCMSVLYSYEEDFKNVIASDDFERTYRGYRCSEETLAHPQDPTL